MKGVYVLLMKLEKNTKIRIGALGEILFEKGYYAYVGSAQNGLFPRIRRHLSKNKKLFWHIDYFLQYAKIVKIFSKEAGKEDECKTANDIQKIGRPIQNFGCSDCKCASHLFYLNKLYLLEDVLNFSRFSQVFNEKISEEKRCACHQKLKNNTQITDY